jgi:hypothetical protein
LAALIAAIVFVGGMSLGTISKAFIIVGFIGFAGAGIAVLGLLFWLRCPSCGENLGYALSWPMTWNLSISKRIRFCQFCGVNLDKEVQSANKKI